MQVIKQVEPLKERADELELFNADGLISDGHNMQSGKIEWNEMAVQGLHTCGRSNIEKRPRFIALQQEQITKNLTSTVVVTETAMETVTFSVEVKHNKIIYALFIFLCLATAVHNSRLHICGASVLTIDRKFNESQRNLCFQEFETLTFIQSKRSSLFIDNRVENTCFLASLLSSGISRSLVIYAALIKKITEDSL